MNPEKIPSKQQSQQIVQQQSITSYSGPIPPPNILIKYEEIQPGFADRIIKMAEKQGEHRQSLELKVINSDISIRNKGQYFAFILGLISIISGTFLIYSGKNIQGFIVLITSLGSLVTAFMYGTYTRSKERKKKYEVQPDKHT
jgi:uncharacterized membrane protein